MDSVGATAVQTRVTTRRRLSGQGLRLPAMGREASSSARLNRAFQGVDGLSTAKVGRAQVSLCPGICAQKGASGPAVPERADRRHNHDTAKPDPPLPLGLTPNSAHGAAAPSFLGYRSQNFRRVATACTLFRTAFGVGRGAALARSFFRLLSSLSPD